MPPLGGEPPYGEGPGGGGVGFGGGGGGDAAGGFGAAGRARFALFFFLFFVVADFLRRVIDRRFVPRFLAALRRLDLEARMVRRLERLRITRVRLLADFFIRLRLDFFFAAIRVLRGFVASTAKAAWPPSHESRRRTSLPTTAERRTMPRAPFTMKPVDLF